MKSDRARIRELEREVAQLKKLVRGLVARPAAPKALAVQRRIEICELQEDLDVGSTAEAFLLHHSSEEDLSIVVSNLTGWPIASGKTVVVFWHPLTNAWYPLEAQREIVPVVKSFDSETCEVCEIDIYVDHVWTDCEEEA